MKNPMQPIHLNEHEVLRFKENKIVSDLLDFASSRGFSLNEIAAGDYTRDDRIQLAQLIGYSISGFGELSYVDDDTYNTASMMWHGVLDERDSRIQVLQEELDAVRQGMKESVARLYGIHPDDLGSNDWDEK